MIAVTTDNCESGLEGTEEPHNHSLRWHSKINGRTFIAYADSLEIAEALVKQAANCTHVIVEPSGYYCQQVNAIFQPKDGPTIYVDNSNGRLT
jgi:hypothetical protein